MDIESLSRGIKNTLLSTLDSVKSNVENMSDAEVMRVLLDIPKSATICCECKHCRGKEPHCYKFHIDVRATDYCSFGERE
jgi:hypothetical protein